jgi:MFS family permease
MMVATLGISLPEVRQTLLLSEIEAGSLFSAIFVVAALASAIAGRLSDKTGRKSVLLMGIGFLSLGFATAGVSQSYPMMLLLLGITGLGYGFTTPSLYGLMSDLLPSRRGLGTSFVSVSYGIGGSLGSVVSSSVITRFGWRAAFLSVALMGAIIGALEMLWIKSTSSGQGTERRLPYRKAVNPNLVLLAVAQFFGASVFWSSASWTPTVLRGAKELSLSETGFVMAVWGLTPMIGALLLGALSDRFGRKVVILWSAYPGALVSFVVYYWLMSPGSLALGLFLFGILKATVPSLVVALAQDSVPVDTIGTASGAIMSMHYVSAVTAPLVAARLIAGTGDMLLSMVMTSSVPFIIYGSLIGAVQEKPRI